MTAPSYPLRKVTSPKIYAYSTNDHKGQLKVGYTERDVESRIKEQTNTAMVEFKIEFTDNAMRSDGTNFKDHEVHKVLEASGKIRVEANREWFICTVEDVKQAVEAVRQRKSTMVERTESFGMRPEQEVAVTQTLDYFTNVSDDNKVKPKMLWNAKMRFGKTFTTYQLAKAAEWKRVLVLTFKPAVQKSWMDDLNSHQDFEGWQFVSKDTDLSFEDCNKDQPIVVFGSFQDFLGKDKKTGNIKSRNQIIHNEKWDCVVLDEYHFGAWRDSASDLFDGESKKEILGEIDSRFNDEEGNFDQDLLPINTNRYLYLSGTPFRAVSSGEFMEDQIFNWTYADEQRAKENWNDVNGKNPYAALPKLVMHTYELSKEITDVAMNTDRNEFDLNTFFKASGKGDEARFENENEVQKFLDFIREGDAQDRTDNLNRLPSDKVIFPLSDVRLLEIMTHTFWYLPSVSACDALENLLAQSQNTFYQGYTVINASGSKAGQGVKALAPVERAMVNPLESKTITLSCGKLTTGVTVKPWTGIFMLRNLNSPESYFQAAFRVQSPWTIDGDVMKNECYLFDFAPNRALRQIADYTNRLDVKGEGSKSNGEGSLEEFINFLPIMAYDGQHMKQLDADGVLDMSISGTTATLLAKGWQSPLLMNLDNNILTNILNNPELLEKIRNIPAFKGIDRSMEIIVAKDEAIKDVKSSNKEQTSTEKKEHKADKKERLDERKKIQEKLLKFLSRIPVFMYASEHREKALVDVIRGLETNLFERITNLSISNFDELCDMGLFNAERMNSAIINFKRYEDVSLGYLDVESHAGVGYGGWVD